MHHIRPLHELKEEYKVDPKNDLIPVCPNCHAMIHRNRNKELSIEDLRQMVKIYGSK